MLKVLKATLALCLGSLMTVSCIGVSAATTTDQIVGGYAYATPHISSITNQGPLGRKISWNAVNGAPWYRVFYKNAKGQWVGMGNTKQTWFYDTHPKASGDVYTVRCVNADVSDWQALSGYDPEGKASSGDCVSHDAWLVNKQIKISGAKSGYANRYGTAAVSVGLYKTKDCKSEYRKIPNGTILKVLGVEAATGHKTSESMYTRFKVSYGGNTGYVKMNYALVNVNQYVPAINVALSFSSNEAYTWYIAHGKSQMTNKPYNMFNYKGSDNYIEGISDQKFYSSNTAWLRYDVAKKLLNAQRDMLGQSNPWIIKLYDAYRPHSVTAKIDKAWDNYIYKYNLDKGLTNQIASANYVSKHNIGTAVDMSIIDAKYNTEYVMPTYMHDLSWNAKQSNWLNKSGNKNQNATAMYNFMTKRGWSVYSGEWWHFEDNSIASSNLVVYSTAN